ncbi:ATP-binding protein [Neptuniibacter sp. QD57_21]|uniref:ATP-binding protein n=2 Tax=unclassified Neptuniibacter TaxID=2630693 RepID=UPI0039F58311
MSRRLFWQLSFSLLAVSLIIFSSLHHLSYEVTIGMTEISEDSQERLKSLAKEASERFETEGAKSVLQLTEQIEKDLNTWSALVTADNTIISSQPIPEALKSKIGFQRYVYWPVHEFMENVLIGIPLEQQTGTFVIELPRGMYPKVDTDLVHSLLTIVIPSFIILIFCWIAYRYLMRPLEALNQGTLKLASGDLSARVLPNLPDNRKDELTQVAESFDSMAARVERLVNSQRQLLGDLSHELRTPLTRIGLAIEICRDDQEKSKELLPRLQREVDQMHQLVEDALTLAWLDGDPEVELSEAFNLATLLDLICDDALFEYSGRILIRNYAQTLNVSESSQQALSQALENVVRNAMKYSPADQPVELTCFEKGNELNICVSDRGPGVPENDLVKIFDPFFRTDKARSRDVGGAGLGLALCQRQIQMLGGSIKASLNPYGGLDINIKLPR